MKSNSEFRIQNSKFKLQLISTVCCLLSTLFAVTKEAPIRPSRKDDFRWYQKNQWKMPITNYGTFGYGIGRAGGEWPAGTGNMYIYGAGIWFGVSKTTAEGKDTFVTCGYDPSSGRSEFTSGAYANATGGYSEREFERVYIYPEDWPPNPSDFPQNMQDSILTPLKMPTASGETVPVYFYPIPRTIVSTGDAWAVFNDRDPQRHVASSKGPRPIGIEVYQSVYAWTLPWNKDIVFFKFDVRNVTAETLKNCYIAMVCDADVGNYLDDMAGLLLRKYVKNRTGTDSVFVNNVGYVWSENYTTDPSGFIGFDFLQSPYAYSDGKDNDGDGVIDEGPDGLDDNANGLIDEPGELEQLGMTAFKIFTLQAGDPPGDFAQYLAMTGRYWHPPYPYEPYDSTDVSPADKRFLQSSGPFNLAPGEIATTTIGVMGAITDRTGPAETWPYYLGLASSAAQAAYDNNWIMPEPPPSPNLVLIPGDGKITLLWDKSAEDAKDRFFPLSRALLNPFYREMDFEGYKVYRSKSGRTTDWELLAQFDKINGIIFSDTTLPESVRTIATDKGLSYSWIDSSNIRLGFPYYYSVTAFDINYLGNKPESLVTLSLESGMMGKAVIARTEPANYEKPSINLSQKTGNQKLSKSLSFELTVITPHSMKSDTYYLQFLGPQPGTLTGYGKLPRYIYQILNSKGDTIAPLSSIELDSIFYQKDSANLRHTVFDNVITKIVEIPDTNLLDTISSFLPVFEIRFKLKMDKILTQPFDQVLVFGKYPKDSLQLPELTNRSRWAYRGSNYRITFNREENAVIATILDLDLGMEIPFRRKAGVEPDSAEGWSFGPTGSSDTLKPTHTAIYLPGGFINLMKGRPIGSFIDSINNGDTWIVYNKDMTVAPVYASFEIITNPAEILSKTKPELNVKVVPNPYLVRNEWERHPDFRKLKFINLPSECKIRIYNLAGDLIRIIEHKSLLTRSPGSLPNQYGGTEDWDLLSEAGQKPAPGIYIFHIESPAGNQMGKFVIIY